MIALLPLFLAASLPEGGCKAVDHTAVLSRDLAPVVSAFAQLPGDFLIGYVQESGAPTIFHAADLERIAHNRGLEVHGLADLCFVRRTFVPQPDQIRNAIQKSLGIEDAKIEILNIPERPLPTGEMIFPRSGVQGVGPEVTWNGYVQASEGTKMPLSVSARITAPLHRVVATADLQARTPIQASQIRVETIDASPFDDGAVRELSEALGFVPKTRIPKDGPLRKTQIERPMDIAFGDMVQVDVFAGAAHLKLIARAETAGMKGSIIQIRNLASGQTFRAQVVGKDRVIVGGPFE